MQKKQTQTCSATATTKQKTGMSATSVTRKLPSTMSVPTVATVTIVASAVYLNVLLASVFFVTVKAEHLLISNATTHIQSGATNVTEWVKSNGITMMT